MSKVRVSALLEMTFGLIFTGLLFPVCIRSAAFDDYVRSDHFEASNLRIAVPPGYFPFVGNEARFKKFFTSDRNDLAKAWSVLSSSPRGVFLDPAVLGTGRVREAGYRVLPIQMECASWSSKFAKSSGPAKELRELTTLGGRDWYVMHNPDEKIDKMVNYAHCEKGFLWSLQFSDIGPGSVSQAALKAFSEPFVKAALVKKRP